MENCLRPFSRYSEQIASTRANLQLPDSPIMAQALYLDPAVHPWVDRDGRRYSNWAATGAETYEQAVSWQSPEFKKLLARTKEQASPNGTH